MKLARGESEPDAGVDNAPDDGLHLAGNFLIVGGSAGCGSSMYCGAEPRWRRGTMPVAAESGAL